MKKTILPALIIGSSLSMSASAEMIEGVWQVQGAENTQATLDTAVEEVVQEMNFFIRKIARSKLKEQAQVCNTWNFAALNNNFSWQCNQDEVFELAASAKDQPVTKQDGSTFTGTINRGDDFIATVLTSDKGVRTNMWKMVSENEMLYTATIESEKLPQPLTWTLSYKLAQ
ncbi:MAG: hypothetical protein ACPGUE_15590 [Marinomonas sp.]|uniref:hypothetical protein n=1 Tax=unclassified Marinomonas TaxID=196814 RepID=UPI0005F9AAB7|nr:MULTISPECIES: hypothetical protein [unclassified Marinomonas]KJZ15616.1 hypothetical protein TW85_01530 [Marinomonas sp. S3726]KZM40630.1 hypothetical protein OA92_16575 [Marinomonas sp. SBI22]KZM42331.1 hypothetical protein OA91_14775 [Marinomonas sp. SBI8L]